MRTIAPLLFALLVIATPSLAAPTCKTLQGEVAKCGTQDAMPFGWTPTPEQMRERTEVAPADAKTVVTAIVWIALLLALIALMPDFQGPNGWDWDRQEDDRP